MYITRAKKDFIRRHYIEGQLNICHMAEVLELRPETIRFYLKDFDIIAKEFPDKLQDFNFFLGKEKVRKAGPWYHHLVELLPELVAAEEGPVLFAAKLYRRYALRYPQEYSKARFYYLFRRWFDENKEALCAAKIQAKYTQEEIELLKSWRRSNDRHRWQVAVALMSVYTYHSLDKVAQRIDCTPLTLRGWLNIYRKEGLAGLDRPGTKRPIKAERAAEIEKKMDELVHLVRQSPKNYGIDRASWSITDLATVFSRESGHYICQSTVSNYLKRRGVRYKRSREVIASTDPLFLEKYRAIQHVLENLAKNEKFFSIDEYGPCSVRPKGGRRLAMPGEQPVYQKVDKGKGWFICTCALELSTNQLTWFYSRKKDTAEMIQLIEVLSAQYQNQKRLFLSWDAASWHASKQLLDYLEEINAPSYRKEKHTPLIALAPLPARAPHLNVIESVFSGMSKSVIRNSDYDSVVECRAAIDRYFQKRNLYFLENPKRAGNKIWGKERVKAVFNKANICRNL
ncbi:IS630 family transposase [Mucilaginibacter sp.]|uniref:IS630 family transposase n=1 Tax=Mucilaginibacter sp. TaxID=1882438 RepID=UPI003D141451